MSICSLSCCWKKVFAMISAFSWQNSVCLGPASFLLEGQTCLLLQVTLDFLLLHCQHPLDHRKSKRVPEKHLLLLYWLHQSLWLCGSQQTVENSERDGNTRPPYLPLRNLHAGQEATVRTGHGTMDWFQIGKGVRQGCILSPCLFNLYAEYIMRNAGLEEAQAGMKIAWRNVNKLRYADDTALMAES